MNILEQILPVILIIAIIAFMLYRQIRPRKISQKSLFIIPAIILFFLLKSLPSFHPTQKELIEMAIMSIVTIILGLLACHELHIYKGSTGKAMARGTWKYFLWWVAAFAIKAILSVIFKENSLASINETEIYLPVFFLVVTRNAYTYWRTKELGLILH